jgi:site-specific recombinase XerD
MPRPRPPYLLKELTRHGQTVWYVRKGDGPRIRVRGDFGTDEFMASYQAAVTGTRAEPAPKTRTGSLKWLYDRYRETTAWAALSPGTRRQRENIFAHVMASAGDEPYGSVTKKTIEAGRDRRRATPYAAGNFLKAMRGLFRWAAEATHVENDPTDGVRGLNKKKSRGFLPWTEDDVTAYQKRWPLGTKERVWLDLILYMGPRRGDACRIGRQHERTAYDPIAKKNVTVISFRTKKGDEQIEVTIPMLDVLKKTLKAGPTGDLTYVVGERGRPYTKESFGNQFSAAARKAGVKKSAHGVRKIAATTCADNGATVHQLMALFGWKTTQMAELYTREANRKRLAREAVHTLSRTSAEQSIPAPSGVVRGSPKKR